MNSNNKRKKSKTISWRHQLNIDAKAKFLQMSQESNWNT